MYRERGSLGSIFSTAQNPGAPTAVVEDDARLPAAQ